MQKVLILGGTSFDHIIHLPALPGPEPRTIHRAGFHEGTGSTGAGKAMNLQRLGVPLKLYSVLGDDAYGEYIRKDLSESGVDATYVTDPAGTERHVNLMDEDGRRISIFIRPSSESVSHDIPFLKSAIAAADILVLNILAYCRDLVPLVRESGKPVWTDLHDYDGKNRYHQDFIDAADYIQLSSDNLPHYKPLMDALIRKGKKLVVCTHGKQGASALTDSGEWVEQPALTRYPYVDGNGAGDAFFSGFLYGWIQQQALPVCMRYGTLTAGLCVGSSRLAAEELREEKLREEYRRNFE